MLMLMPTCRIAFNTYCTHDSFQVNKVRPIVRKAVGITKYTMNISRNTYWLRGSGLDWYRVRLEVEVSVRL
jgi:hypothetical protein